MIVSTREFNMSHGVRNRRRLPIDLCGPYFGDEIESKQVRCYLQIARSNVAIDLPAGLVDKYRSDGNGRVVLHLPGERVAPVETAPLRNDNEQKAADCWSLEMEDFDRF